MEEDAVMFGGKKHKRDPGPMYARDGDCPWGIELRRRRILDGRWKCRYG